MKKFKYIILLTFLSNIAISQSSLKGGLIDANTGESLPGATIYIENLNKGTVTDIVGNFSLSNIISEETKIKFSFIVFKGIEC